MSLNPSRQNQTLTFKFAPWLKKLIPSMFTRLYIGIIIGIVSTMVIFITLGEGYMRRTEIETFLNDGNYFLEQYIQQHGEEGSLYAELDRKQRQSFYIFDLVLLDRWDGVPPCAECELLYELQSIPVYLNDGETYSAIFPIPNSSKSFVFNESRDFFSPEIEWYNDSERLFLMALLLSMIIAIGASIYLPIRGLHRQIGKLVDAQQRFGRGKLEVRAEASSLPPVSELAKSFNSMADEIELRVKQNQIFAQAIPHEVRTPLSCIQLASDLLRRDAPDHNIPLFNDIDTYIDDINQLTSNIMMLTKLNTMDKSFFELTKTEVDMAGFCQERIRNIGAENITFESKISGLMRSKCDCTMARLVLDNVIKNAVKYTQSHVWVTLDENSESWIIAVEDDGPGIPLDKRNEVMLAFSRLDQSRNSQTGGFGLGLAITASAARRLNWDIVIHDSEVGGAKFIVVIPKL